MKQLLIKYDENTGETFFEGLSSEILQRGQLAHLERAFIEIGKEKAEKIIFESTKKFAIETVQKYNMFLISFAKFRRKDIAEILMHQLPQRGFGAGKITYWEDSDGKVTIEVTNSFESIDFKSNRPVCFALGGILAGAYEILFTHPCKCKETKCRAKGDKECVFELSKA
ncbi:MAG: hypothetical protein HYW50_04475 [Candidatus Diapherotrites archaeon]|nr:hypothetical protein [Candidatus Diapherotrites archaeon]